MTRRAVLIDLDGVLYEGERPVPGAAAAVEWLSARRVPYRFVTNTTSRPRDSLVEKLAALDVAARAEDVLTPPVVADRWLAAHAPGPAALFVPEATAADFTSVPHLPHGAESGAASVVLGDLGAGWSFAVLNRAFRLLMAEPRPVLVALGMTRYWRAADGLRLDVAPFARALEHATGAEAVVLGKPARPFFETAVAMLGSEVSDPAQVVMIGDDVVGDVGGAQRAGLRGVLVRTGKFRPDDLARDDVRPDAVLDSLADLPDWWSGGG
jgi:phospholysine phosphohistidine inorganic pyrophosphate phosphatase